MYALPQPGGSETANLASTPRGAALLSRHAADFERLVRWRPLDAAADPVKRHYQVWLATGRPSEQTRSALDCTKKGCKQVKLTEGIRAEGGSARPRAGGTVRS